MGRPDRSLGRKVKEAILATEIEQRFSKNRILELYLNAIYYGHHAYGAQAAARVYFDKDAKDLDLAQASLLAGLPQAPSFYDPQTNLEGAKERQKYVLDQVVRDGFATQAEADAAFKVDLQPRLKFKLETVTGPAPHFVQYVLAKLDQDYGPELISAGGVVVTTSLDLGLQAKANTAVQNGLPRLKYGQANNAALLAEDPASGEILAYVGSADFNKQDIAGQVDIIRANRQPGSSFKPYDYLAGIINHRFNTVSVFDDSPTGVPPLPNGKPVPDFDGQYEGKMRMRTALVKSRNVPAEQAMQRAGIANVIDLAHRMGIDSAIQPNLSSAIGTSELTMLEHAKAYGVLATQGYKHDPTPVLKVIGGGGRDITNSPGNPEQVVAAAPAYIINDILRGYNAEWKMGLDRTMAAKSGTSNVGDRTGDAWLVLYNPKVLVISWAGHTSVDPSVTGCDVRAFRGRPGQGAGHPVHQVGADRQQMEGRLHATVVGAKACAVC